jgi:hypothetical protein
MSTTPPHDPGTPGMPGTPPPPPPGPGPDPGPARTGPTLGYTQISNLDVARMPIPGNAEFVVLVLIEAFLAILLLDDDWNANDWAFASTILGAAYLLSRGIAKASRVLEQ